MIDLILVMFGYIMTFFVVGYCIVELFFKSLPTRIKFPLYFVSSLLLSTYFVYFTSLAFGFNRLTAYFSLIIFLPLFIYLIIKRYKKLAIYVTKNFRMILLSIFVFLIFGVALYSAILGDYDGYKVLSGPNWQDTPMHLSITHSLIEGNFPPQAPYYSGQPLSYYYFADFHTAIIGVLSERFMSKLFVFDNALMAFVLFITIYTFSVELTKNKKTSLLSAFLGTFFSSYLFVKFLPMLTTNTKITELLANRSFSMEYDNIFGMANMADYYLQNRPMMIGIPSFAIVVTIILYAVRRKNNFLPIIIAGLISGLLIKFQFFSFIASAMAGVIILTFNKKLKSLPAFILPILTCILFFRPGSVNNISFLETVKQNFYFGPWDSEKSIFWHTDFLLLNLGFPFIFSLIAFFKLKNEAPASLHSWYLLPTLRRERNPSEAKSSSLSSSILRSRYFAKGDKETKIIIFLGLLFVSFIYMFRFTIVGEDMFKFLYFSVIIFSVTSIHFLQKIIKNKFIFNLTAFFIIATSTISSFLTLSNSFLNKNLGYTSDSYDAGLWVRDNTPQKSVFVSLPTLHFSPSDIGGRLRIISYINWPYSHGFNIGVDNVFIRVSDVENVYESGDINLVKSKYNAKYVYLGDDEKSGYPEAEKLFDLNNSLKKVYNKGDIVIYEIH